MNATRRLDLLLANMRAADERSPTPRNGISPTTSEQPLSAMTFAERDSYPTSVVPSAMLVTSAPLPPRRDSSSLKHHRRRYPIDSSDKQKQPLLNSSTLDDLFRALTLECEQYLAATSSYRSKALGSSIAQSTPTMKTTAESNDDDYENLQTLRVPQAKIQTASPLRTSIEVISPVKRHVVSISVSSRISAPSVIASVKTSSPVHVPPALTTSMTLPTVCHSSEEDVMNVSSSSTNRKRRRRTRKRMVSSTTTRSSSSSTERLEAALEKKPVLSKRSCSTDHRHRHSTDLLEPNSSSSLHRQATRRPRRRDGSLQHSLPNASHSSRPNASAPLSIVLSSSSTSKSTSDFIDLSNPRQPRRSRLESLVHKPSALRDRMYEQFYRTAPTRTQTNGIPTHRIPPYRVY